MWEDKDLVRKFGPLEDDTILLALMAYTEFMIPRASPLDRYLKGEAHALSPEQKLGYQRFLELGCASCHQGVAFSASPVSATWP